MKAKAAWAFAVFLLLALVSASAEEFDYKVYDHSVETLRGGVVHETYRLISRSNDSLRQVLHVLRADAEALSSLKLVAFGNEGGISGRSPVTQKAKACPGAIAGVNADFFDVISGGCCGFLMTDGVWRASSEYGPATGLGEESWAFMRGADGKLSIVSPDLEIYISCGGVRARADALNQLCASEDPSLYSSGGDGGVAAARADNALVLYTPDWGARTPGVGGAFEVLLDAGGASLTGGAIAATVLATGYARADGGFSLEAGTMVLSAGKEKEALLKSLRAGDTAVIELSFGAALSGAELIIGGGRHDGGPLLAWHGEEARDVPEEIRGLFSAPAWYERHARTAVGVGEAGDLILAVCQGYGAGGASGVSIAEMRKIMLVLGAKDALNLDGGASSVMVAVNQNGSARMLSLPGAGYEVAVGNAIFLCARD